MNYELLNGSNLSYIGDSYYELVIRKYLIDKKITKSKELTKIIKYYVSARAHALIFENIKDELNDKELEIFTRGRNGASHSHRKNVDCKEYSISSGFEAIIGYHYLMNDLDRCNELICKAIKVVESNDNIW